MCDVDGKRGLGVGTGALLLANHRQQICLTDDGDPQRLGFLRFAAGGVAHEYITGLLADAAADFAAVRFDQCSSLFTAEGEP